jgi:hypothetical protein
LEKIVTTPPTDDITIVNILDSGSGFATRDSDNAAVFIPASVVNGARLQVGECVPAVLVPNMIELRDKTPLRAIRVPRPGADLPPLPETLTGHDPITGQSLDRMCLVQIEETDGIYYTTEEIAEVLNAPTKMVGNALQRLFQAGFIARAEVHNRVGQSRPTFTLWAMHAEDFLWPEDMEEMDE